MLPAQGKDHDRIIEDLKTEVQALKSRCNRYEKANRDLNSQCDTHENTLEMLRQQIVRFLDSQGTLSTMYHGNTYDLLS